MNLSFLLLGWRGRPLRTRVDSLPLALATFALQALPFAFPLALLTALVTTKKRDAHGPEKTRVQKVTQTLACGPNRAMQPRCAMRFESQIPKLLAM